MTDPFKAFVDEYWQHTSNEYMPLHKMVDDFIVSMPFSADKNTMLTTEWHDTKKAMVKHLLAQKRLYRLDEDDKSVNTYGDSLYDIIDDPNPHLYLLWYHLHVKL